VRFLDYVPNTALYKYYRLANALIVPSVTTRVFKEPWGLIVNEAMNQGCVVIASDAVGAARGGLLEHERTGLVVPEGDATALAAAMRRVLSDSALHARLSEAARTEITRWTYERMARGFIDAVAHVTQS
jgi:glycosyltransferase involved in cell wall biosynthesis